MSREGVDDERLFQYLSAVTLSFEAVALDPLNVANIANAYAKVLGSVNRVVCVGVVLRCVWCFPSCALKSEEIRSVQTQKLLE